MPRDSRARSWHKLDGKIAPAILSAPKTIGDPYSQRDIPEIKEQTINYFLRNVAGEPWANHLALQLAVLSANNYDQHTLVMYVKILNVVFKALFPRLGLKSMQEWNPEKYIPQYLRGELIPEDSQSKREAFWQRYMTSTKAIERWLHSLPATEQKTYEPFILPRLDTYHVEGVSKKKEVRDQQRDKRKVATDAVIPHFASLRAQAHLRHNKLARLLASYKAAVRELTLKKSGLPFFFSFDEELERLYFRIWDYPSFVLAHQSNYHPRTVYSAQQRAAVTAIEIDTLFLEFIRAESTITGEATEGYWFIELVRLDLLGFKTRKDYGTPKEILDQKILWYRQWGYATEKTKRPAPFDTTVAGLLRADQYHSKFIPKVRQCADGLIIPVQSFYDAATFALLALSLFTTTGMRINEALQIRLSPDCFFRVSKAAPPGAQDKSPHIRYGFRLIPKGERRDLPQDYFIGEETKKLVYKTAQMLKEHYSLPDGEPLPSVAFNRTDPRSHRFEPGRYLFQYNGAHLPRVAITKCIRFLMHGMVFLDKTGKNVVLAPHLLRHVFATYAAQVEKFPIDVLAQVLHHKSRDMTEYYSKPTESLVADWQDAFLDHLAAHIDFDEAMVRQPEALRAELESALEKVGTLYQTLGGDCTLHAACPIQFACIGCPANVPDPDKRYQVERERQRAAQWAQEAADEGRFPDAQRWRQQVRRCDIFLKEMDQIGAYRKDEARAVTIRIEDIQ